MTEGEQVSKEFKTIVVGLLFCDVSPDDFYEPSLVEIKYLGEYMIECSTQNIDLLELKNIILTPETGSCLGKFFNDSKLGKVSIPIIGPGEVALLSEIKRKIYYNFYGSKITLDSIESFANSLNKSLIILNLKSSNITDDGLKIIFKTISSKLKETKTFEYELLWDHLSNFNALGLDKLFNCVEKLEIKIFNDYDTHAAHSISISKRNYTDPCVKLHLNYAKITNIDIESFLSQINEINSLFYVKYIIDYDIITFIGLEKVEKMMKVFNETHLTDLEICIVDCTQDNFKLIIDKLRNIKLQRPHLNYTNLIIDYNVETFVKTFEIPELHSLSINNNYDLPIQNRKMNDEAIKELFYRIKCSKLEKFSITGFNLQNQLICLTSELLISSNLTSLQLLYCNLEFEDVRVIAKYLMYSKITSLDLTGNSLERADINLLANIVSKTKLNNLNLSLNLLPAKRVIKLLRAIQGTKITTCLMDLDCVSISDEKIVDSVAQVVKDNRILLKCMKRNVNDKIDEYSDRNYDSLNKAKLIIDKYLNGTILYHYKYKEYFDAFESFLDTEILWSNINNKQKIKLNLNNHIKDNYMKISGIIRDKLEVIDENSGEQKNFSDLSLETINKICSFLSLSDVIS